MSILCVTDVRHLTTAAGRGQNEQAQGRTRVISCGQSPNALTDATGRRQVRWTNCCSLALYHLNTSLRMQSIILHYFSCEKNLPAPSSHKLGPCFKHTDLTAKSRKPTIICQKTHEEMDANHLHSCCSSLCYNHKVLLHEDKPSTISDEAKLCKRWSSISDKSLQRAQV